MTKPFVQVPNTVSAEARKYLESLPDPATLPSWPAPDDIAGWKRTWEAGEVASDEPCLQGATNNNEIDGGRSAAQEKEQQQ